MRTVAATLINWAELWKIIVTALVGGTGVVIVFGLLLLGISRGRTATKSTTRYGLYTLSGLCSVLVVAVAAVGLYATTRKTLNRKTQAQRDRSDASSSPRRQQRTARTT